MLGREGGERTFNHPTEGFLRYQQISFTLDAWPDFRLTMLLPQGQQRSLDVDHYTRSDAARPSAVRSAQSCK